MNGAQALIRTLTGSGVDVCFSNPGTSEMHFVAALDAVPEMRGVLCLFEGVATGAADGYGRMTGRPAAALLHLGPGLANGLANLHNARRARTPLLAVVGDHATYHKRFDAPLESDIDALAGWMSVWTRRSARSADVAADAAEAVAAAIAPPGGIATLILPADVSWSEGGAPAPALTVREPTPVPGDVIGSAAAALRSGEPCVILLGGAAMRGPGLVAASRIAQATGARLLGETFPGPDRARRGHPRGRPAGLPGRVRGGRARRHPPPDPGRRPVPGLFLRLPRPAQLPGAGRLSGRDAGRRRRRRGRGAGGSGRRGRPGHQAAAARAARPVLPGGDLTGESVAAVVGALLPEGAIVSDEANTSGLWLPGATAAAPPHDWLTLTGGSIGQGLPVATGAAFACPDRSVIALEADGSAMYTISALWTQAREGLDVTTVIFNNSSYAILGMELERVGAHTTGTAARDLLRAVPARARFRGSGHGHGRPGQPGPDGRGVRGPVPAGARGTWPAPHRGRGPADRLTGP